MTDPTGNALAGPLGCASLWRGSLARLPRMAFADLATIDVEAALARCTRDAHGRLKLAGLWADPAKAHTLLSQTVRRARLWRRGSGGAGGRRVQCGRCSNAAGSHCHLRNQRAWQPTLWRIQKRDPNGQERGGPLR